MHNIQNIIFDLGGVIIPLDQAATIESFNQLSYMPFADLYKSANDTELFKDFDKGHIDEVFFFSEIRKYLRFEGSDEDLVHAWNAMLLDVPDKRLDVLIDMKQNYKTFLLSNTCETHIKAFEHDLYIEHGVRNFNDYFDKVYYSCRLGMRKPDPEIFEFVLKENELLPEETVFIDDSVEHVKAAGKLGINSYLLPPNTEIGDFLKELKLL
jgi:putative hydrolase of the HAD superfamily